MQIVSLHYWAGAKAAAGVDMERFDAETVAAALDQARKQRSDPRFDRVLSMSSVLIDGLVAQHVDLQRALTEPVRVEILPPFAGGSSLYPILRRRRLSI
jgi:molybdopterin synthase sulfur carrier subunit